MKLIYIFCICLILLSFSGQASPIIDDNKVYINDSKAFISAEPHTLYSSGYVYFTVIAKNYTGNIDLTLGVNTNSLSPLSAELYNPYVVQLINESGSKLLHYVSNISTLTNPQQEILSFGNNYNRYCRKIDYKIFDNVTWNDVKNINICFDSYTTSGTNYTISWNITNSQIVEWSNIASRFDNLSWIYDGFNKWFYAQNLPVEAGKTYTIRVFMNVLMGTKAKYGFAIKPSSQSLQEAKDSGNLYYLDPWVDATRLKKFYLQINNTGDAVVNYSNISINLTWQTGMNADFSDLIFYNETSGFQQYHWFENRTNGSYANLWLNISSLPANAWLNDTIAGYFYLSNATYNNTFGGINTFDCFDDFDDGNYSGKWNKTYGTLVETDGTLNYKGVDTAFISARMLCNPTANQSWAVRTKAKSEANSGNVYQFVGQTGTDNVVSLLNPYIISGVWYGTANQVLATYATGLNKVSTSLNPTSWYNNYQIYDIKKKTGYVKLDVYATNGTKLDTTTTSNQVPNSTNPFGIYLWDSYNVTLDWFFVRSYSDNTINIVIGNVLEGQYIPPSPVNLTQTNSSSGGWVNHIWHPGSGNLTDLYNVSVNGIWFNGSANTSYNNTGLSPGDWSNISVYAYNSTGIGAINLTPASQNIQLLQTLPAYNIVGYVNNSLGEFMDGAKITINGATDFSRETFLLNNTDLCNFNHTSMVCNGIRQSGTEYYTTTGLELIVFAHASNVSQTADVVVNINGVNVSYSTGRPLGGAEQSYKNTVIIIPKYSIYKVYFSNYHHFEWREYPQVHGYYNLTSINGTQPILAQQIGYNNFTASINVTSNQTYNITLMEKSTISEDTVIDYVLLGAIIGGILAYLLIKRNRKLFKQL